MNHIFFIKLYSGSILLLNSRIYINIRLKELFEIDFQREREDNVNYTPMYI